MVFSLTNDCFEAVEVDEKMITTKYKAKIYILQVWCKVPWLITAIPAKMAIIGSASNPQPNVFLGALDDVDEPSSPSN